MPGRVQELLGIEIPIIQAPMTFIAGAQLASAVSEAGALGVIETASPQGRADLARVRELTEKPVAANIAITMRQYDGIIDVLDAAGITSVTTSAGDPALLTERLHDAGITVFHVVGTLRAAQKADAAGVDGLIVEGVEGGGFKNAHGASTMVLLPLVAAQTTLPIVAAGGICDATSMAASFVLGAEGVQMGTRMLASAESPVHEGFKDAVVANNDLGTVLISPPGMPTMRVLKTERATHTAASGDPGDGLAHVLRLYFEGDLEASFANLGQVSSRISMIRPVAEIIHEMWDGAMAELDAGRARLAAARSEVARAAP
jgi:enoyl-[acyl-carrier protein] reductase II